MVEASCHCGAVQWEAPEPKQLHKCNCSFCERAGAIWTSVREAEFVLTTMPEQVSVYQFGTHTVKHYHCANCGMPLYTWGPSFSENGTPDFDNPNITWNVRMAPDFDRAGLQVNQHDGKRY